MVKIVKEVNGEETQLVVRSIGKKMYDWEVSSDVFPRMPLEYKGRAKGLSSAICNALNYASAGIRDSMRDINNVVDCY